LQLFALQRHLGHESLEMVKIYAHFTDQDAEEEKRKYSPADDVPTEPQKARRRGKDRQQTAQSPTSSASRKALYEAISRYTLGRAVRGRAPSGRPPLTKIAAIPAEP
jgi:hypothetical protein